MPDSDEEYTPPGDVTIPEQIDGGAAASISTSSTFESNSGQQRSSGSSFSLEDSPSSAKITVSTAVSIQPLQIHPIPEIDEAILFNSVNPPKPGKSAKSHQLCEKAFWGQSAQIDQLIETVNVLTTQLSVLSRGAETYVNKTQKLMAKQQGEISTLSLKDAKQKIETANLKKQNSEYEKTIKSLEAKLNSRKEDSDANLLAEVTNLKQNNRNFKTMLDEKNDLVKRLEKANKEK
jgi:hypothetical protein